MAAPLGSVSPPSSHTSGGAPGGQPKPVFSGKWHATWWPGASSASGGSSVRHTSCAFQHRVWNRQAGGGLSGLGTSRVSRIRSRRCRCPRCAPGTPPYRGHQRRRVRVPGLGVELVPEGSSTIFPRYMTATWSLMCRTTDRSCAITTCQAQFVLQVFQQVDHLRLDGHVQGGDRLVGHDELGPERERAGDADPLPLAAGDRGGNGCSAPGSARLAPAVPGPRP